MTCGRRDERGERPERETRERGRGEGVTREDLRSLRHEVEAGKEELQELKQKVERSSRLTLQAAKDSGEQRAQLQLVFFALGALRVALEEVLTAYNSGRAQVREGGAKRPPLQNLLYTKLVGHVHERANQNHSGTQSQKVAQELYNHSPEFEIHSVTNATKPPESVDRPWVLVLTFSGSERSKAMRRLWLDSNLSPLFAKGRDGS